MYVAKYAYSCRKRAVFKNPRTTSKGARFIWAASRLIRRDGKLPGGSPQRPGLRLRLEGLIFWAVEYVLCQVGPFGEEIVLEAEK